MIGKSGSSSRPPLGRAGSSSSSRSSPRPDSSESSTRSSSFTSDSGFDFESDGEPRQRRGSDSSQSSLTSQSSGNSGTSRGDKKKRQREAAEERQKDVLEGKKSAVGEIVDNQRANHEAVQDSTAQGAHGQLSATAAQFGSAIDPSPASSDLGRDRLLLNLASSPVGDSGAVGVVAGCAFGSVNHKVAEGIDVSVFGGTNGPVGFAGASFSKSVGHTDIGASSAGTTVMPFVNATSKATVLEVGEQDARVSFKADRTTSLFLSGAATTGILGVGVRLGLSRHTEMEVNRSVSKEEAREALKNNQIGRRTLAALRQKSPLQAPDLNNPLAAGKADKKGAFRVGDEVRTTTRGTLLGGVSLVVGGLHVGGNVAFSGERELSVRRLEDAEGGRAIMRVAVSPKRIQAGTLALDVPLLGVADLGIVRGQLLRTAWDFDLSTEAGRQGYKDVLAGKMPVDTTRFELGKDASPEALLAQVQGLELSQGIALVSAEATRLNSQMTAGAAITAPMYLAGGRLGKVEIGASRTDVTTTIAGTDVGLQKRERRSGWSAELFKFRGEQRHASVTEERDTDAAEGPEGDRFVLSAQLELSKQSAKRAGKIASYLDRNLLVERRFGEARFFGKESRDAIDITAARALGPDDVLSLINMGVVEGSVGFRAELAASDNSVAARFDVIKRAREQLAAQVLRQGPVAIGRIHRALADDDASLRLSVKDVAGNRLEAKANKYAVRFFQALDADAFRTSDRALKRRFAKVGALMEGVRLEQERLTDDPLLTELLTPDERQQRGERLERIQRLMAPLLDLDPLAPAKARQALFSLKAADGLEVLRMQPKETA